MSQQQASTSSSQEGEKKEEINNNNTPMETEENVNNNNEEKQRIQRIFLEDVIKLKKKKKNQTNEMIGTVQRVGGVDDDRNDDEDDEDSDFELEEGKILVEWENGEEEVLNIDEVQIIDRSLLHGDIVCSADDPFKQSGTVINVNMLVDVSFLNTTLEGSGDSSTKVVSLKNINSKYIQPIHYFKQDSYCIYKDWICKIEYCEFNITVMFGDGSKCVIKRANPDKLLEEEDEEDIDESFPYHPCQQINFNTKKKKRILKQAHWQKDCQYNKEKHKVGTVINITPVDVELTFISCINATNVEPPEEIDLKEIKMFHYFYYSNIAVNDIAMLFEKKEESEIIVDNNGGNNDYLKKQKERLYDEKDYEKQMEDLRQYMVVVDRTYTFVDVQWQDGTIQKDIPSTQLLSVQHVQQNDFFPNDYVINKSDDKEEFALQHKIGVVQNVDAKERICNVKWITNEKGQAIEDQNLIEELPIFDLLDSRDYSYRLGDVVLKLGNNPTTATSLENNTDNNEDNNESKTKEWAGEVIGLENEMLKICWIDGSISCARFDSVVSVEKVDIAEEEEEDNFQENLPPLDQQDRASEFQRQLALAHRIAQQISRHGHLDDIERRFNVQIDLPGEDESDEDEEEDNVSWETVSDAENRNENEQANNNNMEDDDDSWATDEDDEQQNEQEEEDEEQEENSLYERGVNNYIHRLIELSSEMNERGEKLIGYRNSVSDYIPTNDAETKIKSVLVTQPTSQLDYLQPTISENQPVIMGNNLSLNGSSSGNNNVGSSSAIPGVDTTIDDLIEKHLQEESEENNNIIVTNNDQKDNNYMMEDESQNRDAHEGSISQFEIIEACNSKDILADHHFKGNASSHIANRKFIQVVQKEWKLLQENLPSNIFVKVFENRLDLIRAVIVGSPYTPYNDGVYVFDIYLPPSYPHDPPQVKFFSYNEKINPNLYENGHICLSLLGTWQGKEDHESWVPGKSNILQVLLSIQGLVLVPEPYYNEANHDKQLNTATGSHNSNLYNENTLLLCIRHMIKNIRHPPLHCEAIIMKNFKEKASSIIARLEPYLNEHYTPQKASHSSVDLNGLTLTGKPTKGFINVLKRVLEKLKEILLEKNLL
ncbi:hypothetical protein ABK040_001468 [Willaertia magna]